MIRDETPRVVGVRRVLLLMAIAISVIGCDTVRPDHAAVVTEESVSDPSRDDNALSHGSDTELFRVAATHPGAISSGRWLITLNMTAVARRRGLVMLAGARDVKAAAQVRFLLDREINGGVIAACIRYLGLCGDNSDVGRIRPYLVDPSDEVRVEAILALTRLGAYEREVLRRKDRIPPGELIDLALAAAEDATLKETPICPEDSYRSWGGHVENNNDNGIRIDLTGMPALEP